MVFELSALGFEISEDLDEQLDVLQENDIHHIEFRGAYGTWIPEFSNSDIQDIAQKIHNRGMYVSSVASPVGKSSIEDPLNIDTIRTSLEHTAILESPHMRIFSFFTPEGVNPSSYQDIVLDRLSVISDIAQHYDAIQLCHENETGTFGDNLERLRTIYERFPGMGAVFDPANFTRSGCDPLECMVGLKDRVRYVHIKDMDKETGRYVMVGKGDARIKEVLEEIKKGDSKGYMLSLEPSLGEYTHGVRALTGPATFTEYANTLKQILREI